LGLPGYYCQVSAGGVRRLLASRLLSSDNLPMPRSVRIAVYVQPRAKRTEIAGRHGTDLKIRVAAPAVDQAANEALLAFIASRLGVRARDVRLVAGATSRHKVLEIDGITPEEIGILLR
jgi:uncharacterized protein